MSNYGYDLPMNPKTFETARFIGITPKAEGFGVCENHKTDKIGVPVWVVSALVVWLFPKQLRCTNGRNSISRYDFLSTKSN